MAEEGDVIFVVVEKRPAPEPVDVHAHATFAGALARVRAAVDAAAAAGNASPAAVLCSRNAFREEDVRAGQVPCLALLRRGESVSLMMDRLGD